MAENTRKRRRGSREDHDCDASRRRKSSSEGQHSTPSDCHCQENECNHLLEQLAYETQGEHEMEFCAGHESDLLTKRTLCDKDLTHHEFIPLLLFDGSFLPDEASREPKVLELIRALADVTVRVIANSTSTDRPDGYTCHKIGGKMGLKRFGSGWVWSVFRRFSKVDNETCPCQQCSTNPAMAVRQWGQFIIRTAKHVIFDDSEAMNTSFELGYDSEEVRGSCPALTGVEVLMSDVDGDFSEVACVTHEECCSIRLEAMVGRYRSLFQGLVEANEEFECLPEGQSSTPTPVVVISHPHGCSKQVSVGEVREERQDYPRNWTYNARTCPGSSGGPVLRLGGWSTLSCVPPHSGSKEPLTNYSCEPWLF